MVDQAKEIGKVFLTHYPNIYTPKSATSKELINKYLGSVSLPGLDQELQSALLQPITEIEVAEALRDSPNGKAPGEDCLPAELYKILFNQIAATLATLFNAILDGKKVPSLFTQAVIVSFLKKDGPAEKPDSYHPISLLNNDYKILMKIWAARITPLAQGLRHHDQCGFLPGRFISA
ncbi:hypothetical protein NDU88_003281 [Pleurodeles waltl]|uniref:Reverse transcriptase domain-containing protein n=1 Tax=Pleurodeles waltl TaxID=8319 RepID=A0AAV7TN31_PLEWA|nr:hypothetical protein NDU88_003281 [Pleurodeles waltl]